MKSKIAEIVRRYKGAYISSSGFRTIEEQIKWVKERPSEYPATLNKLFNDFRLDPRKKSDREYLNTIYDGREDWLRNTIRYFARRGLGFKHLKNRAIDISVKKLGLRLKEGLMRELVGNGYNVIPERIERGKSKYHVPLSRANVLHVDW